VDDQPGLDVTPPVGSYHAFLIPWSVFTTDQGYFLNKNGKNKMD
jgi:hypothetical protein